MANCSTTLAEPSETDAVQVYILAILPFYHIFGGIMILLFTFMKGTPVFIMPRFASAQFLSNIQKYKITFSATRSTDVDRYDLSSLEILFSGAAPLGATLAQDVKGLKSQNNQALNITQGYGLTETSSATHILPPVDSIRKVGSPSLLLPNLEARLVVDGDGDGNIDAEEGRPGELWIRGPSVMKGYHDNPAATKGSITHDGWFKTGYIAIRDPEGYYPIVDRRKELIKYKGFQVPPAELESVLLTHADITDAAVIGVDSVKEATVTELPRSYVVHARPGAAKSEAEKVAFGKSVQKWIQTKAANHKYLRGGAVLIDAVPKRCILRCLSLLQYELICRIIDLVHLGNS
ncbi:hypothetical protein DFP72DRAFT_883508 [Ephemerocybe angulata]|uniref:AMP-dependent synthetase/ligase domain-containing protein n=1 Tax=Ephemerocybe angulata TaxID=980116 RepID=A0A8H6M8W2_9AGAR|nr:hypothetical protein DFP72DRAFT_883508 [Tulosesus angulatus]